MSLSAASLNLTETAVALCSGDWDLHAYLHELCDLLEATEPQIHALLPEPDRRTRLLAEADALLARYPDPAARPPLFGVPVGVKDIFRVDGFPTRCGSNLPAELFDGPEAETVTLLKAAGALILGKTVTTEFAYFSPGPTRNPRNPNHTPGGSSSGSAAAVAAGYCPLALGSQTVGSVIRPAAFCGVIGIKPSYGLLSPEGIIPYSPALDHPGFFVRSADDLEIALRILTSEQHDYDLQTAALESRRVPPLCVGEGVGGEVLGSTAPPRESEPPRGLLAVPEGPYLRQASPQALAAFEAQLARLRERGWQILSIPALEDIQAVDDRHSLIAAGELAQVHQHWFAEHHTLYQPRTAAWIRRGQQISAEAIEEAKEGRATLRRELTSLMEAHGIVAWLSPAAVGPAPEGIGATGDPAMNMPWTHAGVPVVSLPAGVAANGLPLGLQVAGRYNDDAALIAVARRLAEDLGE